MTVAMMVPVPGGAAFSPSGTGAANLLTPSPKEIWLGEVGGIAQLIIDLGRLTVVDSIFLGFIDAAPGATIAASGGVANAEELLLLPPAFVALPADPAGLTHAFARLPEPVLIRYCQVVFRPGGGRQPRAGVLRLGNSIAPYWPEEWGGGRFVEDLGSAEALRDGGFGIDPAARVGGWQWTLGDLADDEAEQLHELQRAVGTTAPIVVAERTALPIGDLVAVSSTITGRRIDKGGTSGVWDSAAHTADPQRGGAHFGFVIEGPAEALIAGFSATGGGAGYADIAFGIFLDGSSRLRVFTAGNPDAAVDAGPIAYLDTVSLIYRPVGVVEVYRNGVGVFTLAAPRAATWFGKVCLFSQIAAVFDVALSPLGFDRGIHYGRLDRLEPLERREVNLTRQPYRVRDWI